MQEALCLELLAVSKSFDTVPVLRDVTFSLQQGEIHGLVGKNGAGKSTLMKILSGVYRKDTGTIRIEGRDVEHYSASLALDLGVVMVYQDLSLVPSLSVTQNIFLHRHPYRTWGLLDDKKASQEARRLLALLGVESIDPRIRVSELSTGECQLVEIAKALALDPKIIVFDEPTVSLSSVEIKVLFSAIRRLRDRGISAVYITHYLNDVLDLCDRVTVLRDGRLILTALTQSMTVKELVQAMLGSEELGRRHWKKPARAKAVGTPVLETRDATTDKLHQINLKLHAGEIVGLVGLLGSGRTEILQMLYGLDTLRSGQIRLNDKHVRLRHPKDALRKGISLVPEERRSQGLVMDFSIENNLVLSSLRRLSHFFLIQRKKTIQLSKTSIEDLSIKATGHEQLLRYLSGGNQQKVVMGKCLASQAQILLLDDPTFGVDIHSKIEIMTRVRAFADQGNAVVFVSSEFDELAEFCDRIYVVARRRIVEHFDQHDVTEESLLEAVQT